MSDNKFSERYNNFKQKMVSLDFDDMSEHDIKSLLHEAEEVESEYSNIELVVKADANSLYGSSASKFYSLYSPRLAEDITMTGKHFTVLVDRAINKFFGNWANEENLKKIQSILPQIKRIRNFTEYEPDTPKDLCCYGDTDSRYVRLDLICSLLLDENDKPLEVPEDNKSLAELGCFFNDEYLAKIVKDTIEEDCNFRNARLGFMKMGHEVTARRCSFIKKKKYIMNVVWEDGKLLDKPKLKFRGVELRRGSISDKAKKILNHLVVKYMQEGLSVDDLRLECLKVIKYIKAKKDKSLIYQITSVSGLKNIELKDNVYTSSRTHIQMQVALSWLNFIKQNRYEDLYQPAFEGQKMQYYYCSEASGMKVIGIPDDVDINKVKNLPEPDWNKMIIASFIKPLCRYILDKDEIDDKDVEYFLMGVKQLNFG